MGLKVNKYLKSSTKRLLITLGVNQERNRMKSSLANS